MHGISASAAYTAQDWQVELSGDVDAGDITYDGRLQSGAPFVSETGTSLRRFRVELSRKVTDATRLIAGLEQDYWKRHIRGRGGVAGLYERYTSWRILAGAKSRVMQSGLGAVDLKGLLVFARPERLQVGFEQQLFDDSTLHTRSATGARLGIGFYPAAFPNLGIEADIDWIRVGRSDSVPLRSGGMPVGTVTQAKHERTAFGLRVNYRF